MHFKRYTSLHITMITLTIEPMGSVSLHGNSAEGKVQINKSMRTHIQLEKVLVVHSAEDVRLKI